MSRVNVFVLYSCCNFGWRDPVVEHIFARTPSLKDLNDVDNIGLKYEDKIHLLTYNKVELDNITYYLREQDFFTNNGES